MAAIRRGASEVAEQDALTEQVARCLNAGMSQRETARVVHRAQSTVNRHARTARERGMLITPGWLREVPDA